MRGDSTVIIKRNTHKKPHKKKIFFNFPGSVNFLFFLYKDADELYVIKNNYFLSFELNVLKRNKNYLKKFSLEILE